MMILKATNILEKYFYNAVAKLLGAMGTQIYFQYVGNYFTSLEMMGVTLTVMKLDDELKELVNLDCESMGLTQFKR